MYIVDYSEDYYGAKVATITLEKDIEVIKFAANSSIKKDFKIHRINEYKAGKLTSCSLEIDQGRIKLVGVSTKHAFS